MNLDRLVYAILFQPPPRAEMNDESQPIQSIVSGVRSSYPGTYSIVRRADLSLLRPFILQKPDEAPPCAQLQPLGQRGRLKVSNPDKVRPVTPDQFGELQN